MWRSTDISDGGSGGGDVECVRAYQISVRGHRIELENTPRVFFLLDVPAVSSALSSDLDSSTLARFGGLFVIAAGFLGRVMVVELPPFRIHGSVRGMLDDCWLVR